MIIQETSIEGCFLIEPVKNVDERGFFARVFDAGELEDRELDAAVAQCSISFNQAAGTLRGLHYQLPPHEETKTVRCTRGRIFDVAVDLRPGSRSYLHWDAQELSSDNSLALYIPKGVAHGFMTLEPESEVLYLISTFFSPESAAGIRWNDPAVGIAWPSDPTRISDRDRAWPLLTSTAL